MFANSFFDFVMMLVAAAGITALSRINTLLLTPRIPPHRWTHRRSDASAQRTPEAALHHLHWRQRRRRNTATLAEIARPRHVPERAVRRLDEPRNWVGKAYRVADRVHRVGTLVVGRLHTMRLLDSAVRIAEHLFAIHNCLNAEGAEDNSNVAIGAHEGAVHGVEAVGYERIPSR